MNYEYIVKSPCKINLSLYVHRRRGDGFHDLTSIFQMVSLEDTIYARVNNNCSIGLEGDFDCKKEDNLIFKAARAFFDETAINIGINFRVEKKIPAGGGVGGGSANCAAVLRLLNYIYPNRISNKSLYEIALKLGSDVPFFLGKGTALVEGRGGKITRIKTLTDYSILLVNPGIHISTGSAFAKLKENDLITDYSVSFSQKMVDDYYLGVDNFSIFKNSFEIALYSDYTFINDIKKAIYSEGAVHCALSGSGSTMFGLFRTDEDARQAMVNLSFNSTYKIFMVKPIEEFPVIEKRMFS